jgi:tetratricopeptide (TPR) repeat protein
MIARVVGGLVAAISLVAAQPAHAQSALEDAQRLFYSSRYEEAAALMAGTCGPNGDLAGCELRTSALLFQIKRAIGDADDKKKAWQTCDVCQEVMPPFLADIASGQAAARATLGANPADTETLFLLGKIDLNYVWLQLGTLGRKTGWGEYWESRRSLDKVLKEDPTHVRAKVARAWIDYIVDTKVPRGTRWILGGGNKKRGLLAVREAADAPADYFSQTEALFALWDMQIRERQWDDAVASARRLARDFPDNADLRKFLAGRNGNVQ